jgi:putative ABC transport system permease protein
VARLFSPLITLWFASEGDLARGNLLRQPGRAAITASTLMIGLTVFILIAAAVNSFDQFIVNLTNSTFTSDVLILPQTMGLYGSVVGADEQLTNRLRALPEVQTVGGLRYATSTTNNQTIQVLGIDPDVYPQVSSFDFVQGKPEEVFPALNTGRVAILNSLAVSTLKVGVGSDLNVQTVEGPQTYHVAGIANDPLSMKLNTLIISQANLQADFHKAEDVMLMINLKPGADRKAALDEINRVLQDYPQFSARLTGEYRAMIVNLSTSGLNALYALGILILIPATLGLLNTLTINVMERTREIGVVRAVGGSRVQVRRMVIAEALLLGLFGAATGVIAGVAASYGFITAFSSIGWKMPYQFPLFGVGAALLLAILLALGSSVLPARNAARLDIIRALQYE